MLTYLDLYKRVRGHVEKTASPAVQQLIADYEYGEGEDLDFIVSLAFEEQIELPKTFCEQLVTLQDDYAKSGDYPLPLSEATLKYLRE
ncbi:hypothetical protein [uncultured Varibaculum sp.]|uniref:hypothetical protein n=1 Tax=uncultured Varibaculum sp. TaxID=413896 RepID=UPI0025965FCB|nr:hypothetical protein [uncultured Varibaculum sp.]